MDVHIKNIDSLLYALLVYLVLKSISVLNIMGPFWGVVNGKMMFKYHIEFSDDILCDKLLFFPWFLIV